MVDLAVLTFSADRVSIAFGDGRPGIALVAGQFVPRAQPRSGARTRYSVTGEHVAACVAEVVDQLAGVERVRLEVPPAVVSPVTPGNVGAFRARWLALALVRALPRAELAPPCVVCGRPVAGHVPPGAPTCSRACARRAR